MSRVLCVDERNIKRRAHYQKNEKARKKINEYNRQYYQRKKEEICEKARLDKVECPYCLGVLYHRRFLPTHIKNRHPMVCVSDF